MIEKLKKLGSSS